MWGWIVFAIWCLSGISGAWYWWTTDVDLHLSDALIGIFCGVIVGPIWWIIVGFQTLIRRHRKNHKPKPKHEPILILRAREQKNG